MSPFAKTFRGKLTGSIFASLLLATTSGVAASANISAEQFLSTPPLYFEARSSQSFVAQGSDCLLSLTPTEAVFVLGKHAKDSANGSDAFAQTSFSQSTETRFVRMTLLGANANSEMQGVEQLSGKANYLIGNNNADWRTGIPLFAKVQASGVYPGVDLIYYADQSARLEYDFVLQPNAQADRIAFRIEGADRVSLNAKGELVLKVGSDEIRQHTPVIYQTVNGQRRTIAGGYRLIDHNTVGFRIGDYDRTLPLVIDPVLNFSAFIGGSRSDYGWAVAVDAANNIYVAGETLSKNLKNDDLVTTNYSGTVYHGGLGSFGDAFVAKYDAVSKALVYITYLGGRTDDGAHGLAVDDDGNAYLTGFTDSRNFPVVPENNQLSADTLANSGRANNSFHVYPINAFVARLNPTGTGLDFSVLLGGNLRDSGASVALDGGAVFVTGMTESRTFQPVPNGFQTLHGGKIDAFVVKLTNLSDPVAAYSTYLGGTNQDSAESIAVLGGEAYVTGSTKSINFPLQNPLSFVNGSSTNVITLDHLNQQARGSTRTDAFVSRISADGSTLIYSTYLGGTDNDAGLGVKVDTAGNAYVTGYTYSRVFPTNTIVMPRSTGTSYNAHAFVTKIAPIGSNLIYSVDFGSRRTDRATGLALNEAGQQVYVTGYTTWRDFFATNSFEEHRSARAAARTGSANANGFLVGLQETGGTFPLTFTNAVLFGGVRNDQPNSVAVRTIGTDVVAWIAGHTTSPDLVITNSTAKKGKSRDAFVTEFLFPVAP